MEVLTVSSLTLYEFEMHMQDGLLPFSNCLCFIHNAVIGFSFNFKASVIFRQTSDNNK